MNLKALLQEKVTKVVADNYSISDVSFIVEHPENESFGDYATNVALVISKTVKQAPMEIAKNLSYKIKVEKCFDGDSNTMGDIFESIEAVTPGFINFKIAVNWLTNLLNENMFEGNNYGVARIGNNMRVALEHSNVNPNKAAHVGHLRNACIGQFIERSYELQGFNVEVQYYANNVGVQVATSMMGATKLTDLSPTSYKKFDHYAWDVYAQMESKIQASVDLQNERLDILKKLDDPKSAESIKQRELASKILFEQLKTFEQLGFDYDVIIFEADILSMKLWEAAFERLKVNSNVYFAAVGASKGCWLVKLGDKGVNPDEDVDKNAQDIETDKIIVRSNGVATYTGKDIAYHMWKFGLLGLDFDYKKWATQTQQKDLWVTTSNDGDSQKGISFSGVDYVIDVIGVEQTYAIDVVKRSLAFLGYDKQSKNMKHINYGFVFLSADTAKMLGMNTSDGKKFYAMSGRKGWGVKIDDLIEMVDAKLEDTYGNFAAIKAVRNGAIKFQMLRLNTFQDLVFDLNEALDLKGFSGPYLQYACVRSRSVLKKAGVLPDKSLSLSKNDGTTFPLDAKELSLMRAASRFPEIIEKSSQAFAPSLLCEYLFDLAKRFNTFYNDLPILSADDEHARHFRLTLTSYVAEIIKEGLWLLGIDVPESM